MELDRSEERLLAPEPLQHFAINIILVPTDFSECSRKALRYAVPLANQFGAKIVLLNVAQFHYAGSEIDDLELPRAEKQIVELIRRRLSELVASETANVFCQTEVCVGKVVPEIITAAKTMKADLIVISTHAGSSAKNAFLGSTTERVVRHAPCPVLVVREREHEFLQNAKPL